MSNLAAFLAGIAVGAFLTIFIAMCVVGKASEAIGELEGEE